MSPLPNPIKVEAEVQQGRVALGGRQDALRLKTRAVELLPDAEGNMAKLQVGGGGEVGGLGVGELNASMGRRGGFGAVG